MNESIILKSKADESIQEVLNRLDIKTTHNESYFYGETYPTAGQIIGGALAGALGGALLGGSPRQVIVSFDSDTVNIVVLTTSGLTKVKVDELITISKSDIKDITLKNVPIGLVKVEFIFVDGNKITLQCPKKVKGIINQYDNILKLQSM